MSRITLPKSCRNHPYWWKSVKTCKYCYDYNLLIANGKTHISPEEWLLRRIFGENGRFFTVTPRKNSPKKRR